MSDVTLILGRIEQGDAGAPEELLRHVYAELHAMAERNLARESRAYTLQPTLLVHDAWRRLGGERQPGWKSRAHFFGAAAEAMRRILVDHARRRLALRRGGEGERVPLHEIDPAVELEEAPERLVAVAEALARFAAVDARKAELVKLRYFGGLSLEEAAGVLAISEPTAKRWWSYARAWLLAELQGK